MQQAPKIVFDKANGTVSFGDKVFKRSEVSISQTRFVQRIMRLGSDRPYATETGPIKTVVTDKQGLLLLSHIDPTTPTITFHEEDIDEEGYPAAIPARPRAIIPSTVRLLTIRRWWRALRCP